MSKSKLGYFIIFSVLFLSGLALFDPTVTIQDNTAWWLAGCIDFLMAVIGFKLINGPPTASA
jgi:hypothetical protein